MAILLKVIYRFNAILIKVPMTYFTDIDQMAFKDMKRYLTLLIIREIKNKTLKHRLSPIKLANIHEDNGWTLLAGLWRNRHSTLG